MWYFSLFVLLLCLILCGIASAKYRLNKHSQLWPIKLLEAERKLYQDIGNDIRIKNIRKTNRHSYA